jgi:hypothetical protein
VSQSEIPAPIATEANGDDVAPTPWIDSPGIVDDQDTVCCLCVDSCTVMFEGSLDSPVKLQPKCDTTVAQFLVAHGKLAGQMEVESISLNGRSISVDHVMEVGQLTATKPAQIKDEQQAVGEISATVMDSPVQVSPTAPWTQPACDSVAIASPPTGWGPPVICWFINHYNHH